jgi:NAD(P)-dependent dehydrogenase (short-subunit alcohol dehydrogenase family)
MRRQPRETRAGFDRGRTAVTGAVRSVVVTGASTGIGHACAVALAGRGYRVFAGVRRADDAERLRAIAPDAIIPLTLDVTDDAAVAEAARQVGAQLGCTTLAGLVNNAGIAIGGPLLHQPLDVFRRQVEVNLIGAVRVTQAFLRLLGADRTRQGPPGRIVNMSSVAGRLGLPFMGGYVASKHALEGVSDSLRRELAPYRIAVVVIEPGSTATPIWDKAEVEDYSVYEGTEYEPVLDRFKDYMLREGRKGYPPSRVADAVLRALTAKRPPHRIAVIPGRFANWTLPRALPSRVLDGLIARQLGLRPKP